MLIKLKYFAFLKERLQKEEEIRDVLEGSCVGDLFPLIFSAEADKMKTFLKVAVNQDYVNFNHELKENDEVVFIPPVAGG